MVDLSFGVLFAEFRKAFEGIGKYVPRVLRMRPRDGTGGSLRELCVSAPLNG